MNVSSPTPPDSPTDDMSRRLAQLEEKASQLAHANAHAAELVAENELKAAEIAHLNRSLAEANARAAELVATNELHGEEISQANARLQTALDEKSRWAGYAAHDLRGGLGAILNLSELLIEDLAPPADSPLMLIYEESNRLMELLSSMLEVVRIEEGRITLSKQPADLREIARTSLQTLSLSASKKQQEVDLRLPDQPVMVFADAPRMRQVLDNLLSNAIKFSPVGSRIVVSIEATDREAVCAVEDSGPGLSAVDFTKLFQSFQKLSAQPTSGESSVGLGLAVSKRLVELHEGSIRADNRQDAPGARFWFTLPQLADTGR